MKIQKTFKLTDGKFAHTYQRNNSGFGNSNLRIAVIENPNPPRSFALAAKNAMGVLVTSHWQGNFSAQKFFKQFGGIAE